MNTKALFVILIGVFSFTLSAVVSCGKDDEVEETVQSVSLENYIVGTWHSVNMVWFANGKAVSLDISKTGQYSALYIEMTFQGNGSFTFNSWKPDSNGLNHWTEETGTYSVKKDIVSIYDPSDGTTEDMVFETDSKNLCVPYTTTLEGVTYRVNLYLKKG